MVIRISTAITHLLYMNNATCLWISDAGMIMVHGHSHRCDRPREHWLPSVALSQRQGARSFWWTGEDLLDLWRTRNGGLTKTGGATLCCRGKSWDLYVSMVKLCAIALSPFEPCLYGQKCSWFQVDCSVGNFSPATGRILWSIEKTTARNIYIYIYHTHIYIYIYIYIHIYIYIYIYIHMTYVYVYVYRCKAYITYKRHTHIYIYIYNIYIYQHISTYTIYQETYLYHRPPVGSDPRNWVSCWFPRQRKWCCRCFPKGASTRAERNCNELCFDSHVGNQWKLWWTMVNYGLTMVNYG